MAMFKQIALALQDYEKFRELLKDEIAHASAGELKLLAQKMDGYDRDFLLKLQSYIDEAYTKADGLIQGHNDREIQKIKDTLIYTK